MFRVEWLQVALDELMSFWLQADATRRNALTAASHAIDQRLSNDPANQGESQGLRIIGRLDCCLGVDSVKGASVGLARQ